uniref:Ubiquitin-like domain-containing protein n=1 Tax=Grammatophora oceanica TaxID=210454 RepID=A0A7S1VTF0_9STRA|mmetsp:Transcript_6704/g.9809  ORF Transcript_6704/g.9809 Transcript_6704/m.9809 type:complete len:332 (+) Transcript_6704:108-1103(+)|eukprot:CAMPEP_0194041038 /NCGR_PEP_ID=MMETSP0009_2-20130614/12944_1 /TAXON_ID=210454 /ORGANISM="Grammatophora oceanica, Strain CCMP 410" /LENGTH=331 /DNA_ID=CAMNT_0038684367 /DNA_START=67 /DNA_END=1062 /DNA_ORIENTATION=-
MNNRRQRDPLLAAEDAWSEDGVDFDSDYEDDDVDVDDDHADSLVSLRIREATKPELEIQVESSLQVAALKSQVKEALGPSADGRYLRLISKGRLLAPDTAPLKDFSVGNGDVLHAVLAAAGVRGGQQAAIARGTTRRLRGTGVSSNGRIDSSQTREEDYSSSDDEEEGRERLGFDRLRASGLSRQEITAIRTYFSRQVDRWLQQNPNLHDDEPDMMRRRYLQEDSWMQAQGPASEFRLNLNQNTSQILRYAAANNGGNGTLFRVSVGTDKDFLWGFFLGFFVGFLMLVWVWMPTVPHKQKLGILCGISLQLALSLLKTSHDDEDIIMDEGV